MIARVDVVIPSWNGRDLLAGVLASLRGQTLGEFATIVVDNGSADGTVEWLAREHPGVRVVALPENVGFAPAVNAGIAAGAADYVALLNNDMELASDWLARLVAALDADPAAGAAAPKQRSGVDRDRLDGAGDVLAWTGGVMRRGFGEPDRGQYDAPEPVFGTCGGAALYRRSALDAVGCFEPSFFAYLEDADWALRALLRGYRSLYEPRSLVWHLGGATTGRTPGHERYLVSRNHVAFVLRTWPAAWLARWWPLLVAELARQWLTAARAGQGRIVLRGWRAAWRRRGETLAQRRVIQATRTPGLRELEAAAFGRRRTWADLASVRPSRQGDGR